ncbi:unnamed protein product [Citrullus colocynthis]|uniref:Uncharacterized protein n=1 Tax=Citrullus colocynthis TaxID=252529 RepID=A0ABP0YDZ1_9ROSI
MAISISNTSNSNSLRVEIVEGNAVWFETVRQTIVVVYDGNDLGPGFIPPNLKFIVNTKWPVLNESAKPLDLGPEAAQEVKKIYPRCGNYLTQACSLTKQPRANHDHIHHTSNQRFRLISPCSPINGSD